MQQDREFKKVFDEFFLRECASDPNAHLARQKYWNFYYNLWKSLKYIQALERKMDEYERLPVSKRRLILESGGDGHANIVKNPYYNSGITESRVRNNNFCFKCGEKIENNFAFCPVCGNKV